MEESTTNPTPEEQKPQTETPTPESTTTEAQPVAPTPETKTPAPVVTTSNKLPKKQNLVLILIAAIVLIGGAIGAWWWTNRDKTKTSTSTTPVVQNDVPLIRYGTFNGPVNDFYPKPLYADGTLDVNRQIFEGLVAYQSQTKIVPELASGWKNPDSTTWVFTLRSGVKFHTGRTMTADDVKASIEAVQKDSNFSQYTSSIASITVSGNLEVTIKTKTADPILLNRLVPLYIFDTKSGKTDDPINGTGGYVVKTGTTPSENSVQLTAFDDFHSGKPKTREVDYTVFDTDDNMLAAAKKGELDVFSGLSYSLDTGANLESIGFKAIPVPSVYIGALNFATLKPGSPTAKLKVRQAIYDLLDPAKLISDLKIHASVADQIVPSTIPGFNPDIQAPKRDVAAAKKLLSDAGYPNGVTITIGAGSVASNILDEISTQLADGGITVTKSLAKVDSVSKFFDLINKNTYDAWLFSNGSGLNDISDVVANVFQKTGVTQQYDNATVDTLLTQANSTIDSAKRLTTLKQISKTLMDDVAWAPLYNITYTVHAKSNLNFTREDPTQSEGGALFWQVSSNQ